MPSNSKEIIRTPLRFRSDKEQAAYFKLRKQSNKENRSLNAVILDLVLNALKSPENDKSNT